MPPSVQLRVDVQPTADGVAVHLTVIGATFAPDGPGPAALPGSHASGLNLRQLHDPFPLRREHFKRGRATHWQRMNKEVPCLG